MQELISELHNGNDRQRRAASYKLSKSKDPAAVPALIHAYNDADGSVRQNAINGLRAIATPEAFEFLTSQKDKVAENVRIVIDGGELKKAADGKIMIGSDPTVMTWLGIVFWGVLTLGLLALVIKIFLKGSDFADILVLLFPICLFGYLAFSAYQRTRRGQVIIDPTSHKIKSRKREIDFGDIKNVVAHQTRLPLKGGVIKVTFLALVTNGSPMTLGSISGDILTTSQKTSQIMNLLAKKGLTINFNNIVLNNSDGGTNIFNGFRHKSNDGPQNDEVKIEFGFKGEDLLYRQASKEIYVGFTFLHGYRIYPDDIKKWRDGSKLTEAEKEKVFVDLVNFVNKKRGKPIVIINTDDASKALWEDLCSTHASVIDKIVYTSDKEDFELNRTSSLATIRSGGAVILDNTEITNTNVEDLDNALANEIRKTRERLDN